MVLAKAGLLGKSVSMLGQEREKSSSSWEAGDASSCSSNDTLFQQVALSMQITVGGRRNEERTVLLLLLLLTLLLMLPLLLLLRL